MQPTMKTAAERKAKERRLKKESGLVRKEIWIKPDHWAEVKKFINLLK